MNMKEIPNHNYMMHEKDFEFLVAGGRLLNLRDWWEGYFGQREWLKTNSTNEIPIAFWMKIMNKSPHFAWMQGWCDLLTSMIMNENYCALVCKYVFQRMNELWYEQCYMIMYERWIKYQLWGMNARINKKHHLLHLIEHLIELMV